MIRGQVRQVFHQLHRASSLFVALPSSRSALAEATMTKYGSPYFARNEAGAALTKEVYSEPDASAIRHDLHL